MNQHKKNIYSQNGEDGILLHLLPKIERSRLVVEFGAWDGKHMSNTFNLVKNWGWNAIYIEGDEVKFKDLLKTAEEHPSIYPVCEYVGLTKQLEDIIDEAPFGGAPDVLSIDIDGLDYKIWDNYNPKFKKSPAIVIIEINSSLEPTHIMSDEELTYHLLAERGVNFMTMVKLAEAKGYTLVAHTGNCIFVRNDYAKQFDVNPNAIELFDTKWFVG